MLKSGPTSLDIATRSAMNVDSAFCGAGMFRSWSGTSFGFGDQGTQPMKIGNVESTDYPGKLFKGKTPVKKNGNQMTKDRRNGTCFVWHKLRCRAR